jgi:hypothetical protein
VTMEMFLEVNGRHKVFIKNVTGGVLVTDVEKREKL